MRRGETTKKRIVEYISTKLAKVKDIFPKRDTISYRFAKNGSVYNGTSSERFLELLTERHEQTRYARVKGARFEIVKEKALDNFINDGLDKDLILDYLSNGIVMKKGRETYPITAVGEDTMKRIISANWDQVPANLRAAVYNAIIGSKGSEKGSEKEYTVIEQDGAILAIMGKDYVPFPPKVVMETTLQAIKENYGEDITTIYTYADKAKYSMEIGLNSPEAENMKKALLEQLEQRAKRIGIPFDKENISPMFSVQVSTGETGNSTVRIVPRISMNGNSLGSMPIGKGTDKDLTIWHKGSKKLETIISDAISGIFAGYTDIMDKLIIAGDVRIASWRATISNIAEKISLNKDITNQILVEFNELHGEGAVTGFDILAAFMDSSGIYMRLNPTSSEAARTEYDGKIAKVFSLKLADYDDDAAEVKSRLEKEKISYPDVVLEGIMEEIKLPIRIRKILRANLEGEREMYKLMNFDENGQGMEKAYTGWDIYQMLVNSSVYMEDWYTNQKKMDADEMAPKMAAYKRQVSDARKLSYIKYDEVV